jgi:hypothetical protein
MAVTVSGTGITFNDATTQTTAATASTFIGSQGRTFTTTGANNWTVPTGVTAVRVRVIGGGGGGGVYGVGSAGGAGGTSSFGTYVSCTGGAGGTNNSAVGVSSTGGTVTVSGVTYYYAMNGSSGINPGGSGGAVQGLNNQFIDLGCSGSFTTPAKGPWGDNSSGYGNGGSGGNYYGQGGASGAYAEAWVTGLTSGGTVVVTIGTGGTSSSSYGATVGRQGLVIVEW